MTKKRYNGSEEGAAGKEAGGAPKKKKKRQLRETVEAVIIALVLALFIRTFVVQAFKIPSSSMEDTLLIGDHIIVSKFAYGIQVPKPAVIRLLGVPVPFFETRLFSVWGNIKRGDIIVFRFPGDRSKDYIKRVIGLPGDTVEIRDRVIYINGKKMDDPYGVHKGWPYGVDSERGDYFGPYTVPAGHVFAMGDNRERSFDSRFWGPVPISDIKGKAFLIYWSWNKDSHWIRAKRIFKRLH
ncbi:MAG: signal peptidase I [Thermodesulfobacteriota bacterium]|nr:MAG: signal peptidase I [Thermodesulfobacteriota bacterium]